MIFTKTFQFPDTGYKYHVSWENGEGKETRHFATISQCGTQIEFCCTKYPMGIEQIKVISAKMESIQLKYFAKELNCNPCIETKK